MISDICCLVCCIHSPLRFLPPSPWLGSVLHALLPRLCWMPASVECSSQNTYQSQHDQSLRCCTSSAALHVDMQCCLLWWWTTWCARHELSSSTFGCGVIAWQRIMCAPCGHLPGSNTYHMNGETKCQEYCFAVKVCTCDPPPPFFSQCVLLGQWH